MPEDRRQSDQVKAAVKEALDDKRMEDMARQLTDISTQMTAGFAAVGARQDVANGKLITHGSEIQKLKDKEAFDKYTWLVITTLVAIVVYFVTKG